MKLLREFFKEFASSAGSRIAAVCGLIYGLGDAIVTHDAQGLVLSGAVFSACLLFAIGRVVYRNFESGPKALEAIFYGILFLAFGSIVIRQVFFTGSSRQTIAANSLPSRVNSKASIPRRNTSIVNRVHQRSPRAQYISPRLKPSPETINTALPVAALASASQTSTPASSLRRLLPSPQPRKNRLKAAFAFVRSPALPLIAAATPLPSASAFALESMPPNISSSNQSGGINAGSISGSTITQGSTPVESKFKKQLQGFYAQGADLREALFAAKTPQDASDVIAKIDKWYNDTIEWIRANMTSSAASRFTNGGNHVTIIYDGLGPKGIAYANGLDVHLTNLEDLMKSQAFDP